jgi:ADP-ribose pyrophosphatase
LPAGLAGDEPDSSGEDSLLAAQRELLEETGYVSNRWSRLMAGPSSAGLSDEIVELFLAEEADQQTAGGGIEHEEITVQLVPLGEMDSWLETRIAAGALIDFKVPAGLHFIRHRIGSSARREGG